MTIKWWMALPLLVGCQVGEKVVEEPAPLFRGEVRPSLFSMGPDEAQQQSQTIINRSAHQHPALVGSHALKGWMGSPGLRIWHLCPEPVRARYAPVEGARPLEAKEDPVGTIGSFRGTLVLVGHRDGSDRIDEVWKALKDRPGLRVVVLAGGIEAWTQAVESSN